MGILTLLPKVLEPVGASCAYSQQGSSFFLHVWVFEQVSASGSSSSFYRLVSLRKTHMTPSYVTLNLIVLTWLSIFSSSANLPQFLEELCFGSLGFWMDLLLLFWHSERTFSFSQQLLSPQAAHADRVQLWACQRCEKTMRAWASHNTRNRDTPLIAIIISLQPNRMLIFFLFSKRAFKTKTLLFVCSLLFAQCLYTGWMKMLV